MNKILKQNKDFVDLLYNYKENFCSSKEENGRKKETELNSKRLIFLIDWHRIDINSDIDSLTFFLAS